MELHYYANKYGIPSALLKGVSSFLWTVFAIAVAYVAHRFDLIGTTESVGIAAAIRTLVSIVFEYLKVQGDISDVIEGSATAGASQPSSPEVG